MFMKFKFQKEKMEELGIAGIFLFGSQAQGTANKTSDFDFAVLVKNKKMIRDAAERKKIYNKLYEILSKQINALINIDIVFVEQADLQIKHRIAQDGVLLYLGDQKIISNFLETTMEEYADFAPLRSEFHKAILQRI